MPVRSLAFNISFDTDRAMTGLAKTNKKADTLKGKMKSVGNTLERNKERLAGFAAAGAFGIGAALKSYSGFEHQMIRVKQIAGANEEQFKSLKKEAYDLGKETAFSIKEVASAQEELARAGNSSRQIIGTLPDVLDLAATSNLNLAQSASTTSDIMKSMGLTTKDTTRIVDTLVTTASNANTNVSEVGQAMSYAAPVAKNLGFELESVSSAIGLMASTAKGSKAGRYLRTGMNRLAAPTKEAKKIMDKYNISITNAQGQMKSFPEIVKDFETGLSGLSKAQRQAALSTIFGQEAATGFAAIIRKGSEDLTTFREKLYNSVGITSERAKEQLDSLWGSFIKLRSSIGTTTAKLARSLAPVMKRVNNKLTSFVNWIGSLPEPVQKVIAFGTALTVTLIGLAAAVGFLVGPLSAFGGLFTSGGLIYKGVAWFAGTAIPWLTSTAFPALIGWVSSAASSLFWFGARVLFQVGSAMLSFGAIITSTVIPAIASFTVALLTNPITWVVAGVAALTYGLYKLATNWGFVKEKFGQFMKFISPGIKKVKSLIGGAWDWVKKRTSKLWSWITGLWPKEGIMGFLIPDNFNLGQKLGGMIQNSLSALPGWLQGPAKKIISFIGPNPDRRIETARKNDQQAIRRTRRTIQNNQTSNKTEVKMGNMIIEGADNPEETARVAREEVRKELERAGAAAGVN